MTKKLRSPLDPNSYGKSQSAFVDYDYLDKLNPADTAWFEKFNREYYGGVFPKDEVSLHDQEQKREIWRTKKKRSSDMMSSAPGAIPPDFTARDTNSLNPELLVMHKELQDRKKIK